jgi:hypothetical protein
VPAVREDPVTTTPKTAGGAESVAERTDRAGPAKPDDLADLEGRDVPPTLAPPVPSPCVPAACPPPVGQSWALPSGPGCARYARAILGEALALAGAPSPAIADARLIVSELATNAHQHAGDHGPHELWLYAAPQPGEEAPGEVGPGGLGTFSGEARCAIFDRYRGARLPGYSWTSGDYGRGLSIVHELSDGRWGMLRTLSRSFPRAPGKAVWFAIPVPLTLPAGPQP